jgi:hypothetical protein
MNSSTDTPPNASPAMTELVGGLLSDARTLVVQQAALLKAEVKADVRRAVTGAQYTAVGGVFAAAGAIFLAVAGVNLLAELLPALPRSAAWAIGAGVLFAAGAGSAFLGYRAVRRLNPLPDQSFQALRENVACFTTTTRN